MKKDKFPENKISVLALPGTAFFTQKKICLVFIFVKTMTRFMRANALFPVKTWSGLNLKEIKAKQHFYKKQKSVVSSLISNVF